MPAIEHPDEMSDAGSATILVVDNDPRVRDLVARWLTADGHACAQAATAEAAWEHLQAHECHLVTLDIPLAGCSGMDLLHRIAQTYPDTAVIMVSGVNETPTAIEALTHGAIAYLIKPVSREELTLHARRALERRQLVINDGKYRQHLEQQVREQTVAIRRAHEETIYRLLTASLWHDEETGMHLRRTGLFSEVLARAAGWSAAEAENLRLAAPMHDVGKIAIPDTILRKPGRLFLEEFAVMKQHTIFGAEMLAGSDVPMLQMAHEIALNHHERWDGEGYPAGLAGQAIPESARIVSIVDVYDALIHDRVYRPAVPEDQALEIMRQGSGVRFDPLLLSLFFIHLPEISRIAQAVPDEPAASLQQRRASADPAGPPDNQAAGCGNAERHHDRG